MKTKIEQAEYVVAWNAETRSHEYRRNQDIIFDERGIIAIAPHISDGAELLIDGRHRLVIPGLINIHCHPSIQSLYRGYTEEFGNPRLFNSGRDPFRQEFVITEEAQQVAAQFTLAELIAGGVTTIVDLSHSYPDWLRILADSGIRACVAPMFRSARWYAETGHETLYEWNIEKGELDFEEAKLIMEDADRHPSERLFSMVAPAQVDTCTEDLLRESAQYALDTNRRLHVHASQSYAEFQGMVRRHNCTPIEWLHSLGFLSDRTILGHAVFSDEHPWLHWPTRNDLNLLATTKTSVAHCPTPFARDGTLLHDIGSYRRRNIPIGIGTDTHPHNLLEEMRWAEILGRVAAGPQHTYDTAQLFRAVTSDAAEILGRKDIGRLEKGVQADVVVIDLNHPSMAPVSDPIRSLIYSGADRAVEHVFVQGNMVCSDHRVTTIDRDAAARAITRAQSEIRADVQDLDKLTPPTFSFTS
jgi:cytosine/adenosine deaminase-related metal-dependent hydrolase